jgi:hypothetical protein
MCSICARLCRLLPDSSVVFRGTCLVSPRKMVVSCRKSPYLPRDTGLIRFHLPDVRVSGLYLRATLDTLHARVFSLCALPDSLVEILLTLRVRTFSRGVIIQMCRVTLLSFCIHLVSLGVQMTCCAHVSRRTTYIWTISAQECGISAR